MINIDRYFFGLAVLAALTGMTLGIVMAAQQNFQLAPVHAHINLVGWASLALFGLAYRTGLARNDGLAKLHFLVALASVVVFPVGIYYAVAHQVEIGAMIGSLLVIASMLLFGVNFLRGK